MPTYKLTYFNAKGKAELIRLSLAAAGEAFEDVRIEREQWPALKPSMPLGQLPVLEIDGKKYGQSNAIVRNLARTYSMYGSNSNEMTMVDVVMDTVDDSFVNLGKIIFEKDEAKKATTIKEYQDNFQKTFLKYMESLLEENSSNGWLVGSTMTVADLAVFNMEEFIISVTNPGTEVAAILKEYPKLLTLRQRIKELPKISKYLEGRPVTQF